MVVAVRMVQMAAHQVVDMITMYMVQVTVVQAVNVAIVLDRRVATASLVLADGALTQRWGSDESRLSCLVFIGRNFDEAALRAGFISCQVMPHG